MTKMHFISAAKTVRAIAEGHWTNELPSWATRAPMDDTGYDNWRRAVQTAEAFILLAQEFNPRFDVNRFLVACGLVDVPAKHKRVVSDEDTANARLGSENHVDTLARIAAAKRGKRA